MEEKIPLTDSHEKISLNVCGQKFSTFRSTLGTIPSTRISSLNEQDPSYRAEDKEYFFDRNPQIFSYILDGFRNGEIAFPTSMPPETIIGELEFWGIEQDKLSTSSNTVCAEWNRKQEVLDKIDAIWCQSCCPSADRGGKKNIWLFLEDPRSSIKALIWAIFFLLVLLMVTVCMCLVTVGGFDEGKEHYPVIYGIICACAIFFAIELLVRFAVCPNKLRFFLSFFNIFDVLSVSVLLVVSLLHVSTSSPSDDLKKANLAACALVSLRILKVFRHSTLVKVVYLSTTKIIVDIFVLICLLYMCAVIFSILVFAAEHGSKYSHFRDVPDAGWYVFITMTTVGYGDYRPLGHVGKAIGVVCALTGVLIFIMQTALTVNRLRFYYDCVQLKESLNKKPSKKGPALNA